MAPVFISPDASFRSILSLLRRGRVNPRKGVAKKGKDTRVCDARSISDGNHTCRTCAFPATNGHRPTHQTSGKMTPQEGPRGRKHQLQTLWLNKGPWLWTTCYEISKSWRTINVSGGQESFPMFKEWKEEEKWTEQLKKGEKQQSASP